MFLEREQTGDNTLVVHCHGRFAQQQLDEFLALAHTSHANVLDCFTRTLREEHPTKYLTTGLLDELATLVATLKETDALTLVLINAHLRPVQERALEQTLGCRVIDRTGLILDVFAKNAQSDVGKLQVELAQLRFFATRLKRAWTHLERQKGGIGLRGPGESQLATDKHLIRQRVAFLQKKLRTLQQQRAQNRKRATHNRVPRVALVGYTNAGKSTLHHALTNSHAYAEDKLFATLDSLSRVMLIGKQKYIVTDTIGFIDNLPHQLIASFKATLDDVLVADVLVHVVDASSDMMHVHIRIARDVLREIGAGDKPTLLVYNKCDAYPHRAEPDSSTALFVSARDAINIHLLKQAIVDNVSQGDVTTEWQFTNQAQAQQKLKHKIYQTAAKIEEVYDDIGASVLKCRLSAVDYADLQVYARNHCVGVIMRSLQ